MERLTHERVNGIKTGYWSAATKEVLVQKLAAYENTGYEPDEIRAAIEKAAKNNERNNTTAGGIGFCGLLAVAFIVLKLTGVINWSWLWVLAPIWIPTAITLAIIVIVLVAILVRELTKGGRP